MHCFSSRVTSWLTWTLRVGRFVLRRRIGASVIRPSHLGWPTQQQRRSQEAVAVLWSQTIPWDRHRQIERKFCTIVGGVVSPPWGDPDRLGDAAAFFRLTDAEAHFALCSCVYGQTMQAAVAARRVRMIAHPGLSRSDVTRHDLSMLWIAGTGLAGIIVASALLNLLY